MVNLLFISNNSKIDIIKNSLQPLLKVKIDCVGDFDYGLKEVFEKRPAMVFFQDQIAGVTGESVVRHIQMLLGSDAPSFIFMHNGNSKAKSDKGLYDYLIDLSQDNTKVVADIQSTLKLLLGPQWKKIYVPPKQIISDDTATLVLSSPHDQLEEIYSETASDLKNKTTVSATVSDSGIGNVSVTPDSKTFSVPSAPAEIAYQVPAAVPQNATADPEKSLSAQAASPEIESSAKAPISADKSKKLPPLTISPADFKIEKQRIAVEATSEESLRAIEAKYLSTKTAARKRYQSIAVVMLLCLMVGGGWYLVKRKPHLLQSVVKETTTAIMPVPATKPLTPVPAVQKSESTTHVSESTALPSFIPRTGYDRTFASQKPGWERYVGNDSEFRVFRSAGKLKALQVIATEGHVISESRLKTILIELAGTGEYHITSHEQKNGFQVSRASVIRNTDLLIYRKKSAVHAFVVSLDR